MTGAWYVRVFKLLFLLFVVVLHHTTCNVTLLLIWNHLAVQSSNLRHVLTCCCLVSHTWTLVTCGSSCLLCVAIMFHIVLWCHCLLVVVYHTSMLARPAMSVSDKLNSSAGIVYQPSMHRMWSNQWIYIHVMFPTKQTRKKATPNKHTSSSIMLRTLPEDPRWSPQAKRRRTLQES